MIFGKRKTNLNTDVRPEQKFKDPGVSSNSYGIDLGTCNIKIYNASTDKIMVQKNLIAVQNKKRMIAYGDEAYDWLFMPSETTGNSSLPVGDKYYCLQNLNGYRIARMGGRWSDGYSAGGFFWSCGSPTGNYGYDAGGRLLFVPTATV